MTFLTKKGEPQNAPSLFLVVSFSSRFCGELPNLGTPLALVNTSVNTGGHGFLVGKKGMLVADDSRCKCSGKWIMWIGISGPSKSEWPRFFFSKDIERQDPTIYDPFSSIFNRHLKRLWTRLAIESIEILQLRPWNPRI